jgi:deferrochelatase/peroxidase EfeB
MHARTRAGTRAGATMFSSADGFEFKNMTAKPSLTGSDTQDVVFWDPAVGGTGSYVCVVASMLPTFHFSTFHFSIVS